MSAVVEVNGWGSLEGRRMHELMSVSSVHRVHQIRHEPRVKRVLGRARSGVRGRAKSAYGDFRVASAVDSVRLAACVFAIVTFGLR